MRHCLFVFLGLVVMVSVSTGYGGAESLRDKSDNDGGVGLPSPLLSPSVTSRLNVVSSWYSEIYLSWGITINADSSIIGYEVEYVKSESDSPPQNGWSTVPATHEGSTCDTADNSITRTCVHAGLEPHKRYWYRVAAIDRLGKGAFSSPLSGIALSNPQNFASVDAGGMSHTCALTTHGGVKCWGWNDEGQLGNGIWEGSSTPTPVKELNEKVSLVSVGSKHTCTLTNGRVKCWGANSRDQLGGQIQEMASNTPVEVIGLDGVSSISAGGSHTCALTVNNEASEVKCWGANGRGQLGNGTRTGLGIPKLVTGLDAEVSSISAGGSHTCALTTDGEVKCWGNNSRGQLGNGTQISSNIPVNVIGLDARVSSVGTGQMHTCALTTIGEVKCWGGNSHGQLGNGTRIGDGTGTK